MNSDFCCMPDNIGWGRERFETTRDHMYIDYDDKCAQNTFPTLRSQ